jgi:hypothetical protein
MHPAMARNTHFDISPSWGIQRKIKPVAETLTKSTVTSGMQGYIYEHYADIMKGYFRMRFIVGKLTQDEMAALKKGDPVIAKMLLIPDDYKVFHYKTGDEIEVETEEGDRVWARIRGMEVIEDPQHVIIMFTLTCDTPVS